MKKSNVPTTNEWLTVMNLLSSGSDLAAMYQADEEDTRISNLRGIIDSALIILESKKEGMFNVLEVCKNREE